ncbi:hypothetical protein PPYR_10228 [Photinus pyralis]|uniref:Uncharacterized protein n=1 Tax=Photinus pyralis TaxID=7054 RepID=A0A5N4AFR4_PHOPY|nr:uncharacterized protein LOC116173267 [Photinus pyralis]KAB0796167.1 hypothetical protein PPYR_10228 [Photinus pyralis]
MKSICLVSLLAVLIKCTTCSTDPYTECLDEEKVKKENLHNVTFETNPPIDSKSGEYFLCVWKKIGVMNHDGDVDRERFKKFIEEEIQGVRHVTPFLRQLVTASILDCDLKRAEVPKETAVKVKNCHSKIIVNVLSL